MATWSAHKLTSLTGPFLPDAVYYVKDAPSTLGNRAILYVTDSSGIPFMVRPDTGRVIASEIGFTATATLLSTDVQAALEELDGKIAALGPSYKGVYSTIADLTTAYATGTEGEWAIITNPNGPAFMAAWVDATSSWEGVDTSQLVGGGAGTDLTVTYDTTFVNINSSTGADTTLNAATVTTAGVMTADDKVKLDNLNSKHKGVYADIAALSTAYPTGVEGEWAIITNPNGPAYMAAWDGTALAWEGVDTSQIPSTGTDLSQAVSANYIYILSSTGGAVKVLAATSSDAGFMSASDKAKLDLYPSNGRLTCTVTPSTTTLALSGSNMNGVSFPPATQSLAGVLTAADKTKLDGLSLPVMKRIVYESTVTINPAVVCPGFSFVEIMLVGGGGGGAGATCSVTTSGAFSSGGSGACTSIGLYTAAQAGTSLTISIGSGGAGGGPTSNGSNGYSSTVIGGSIVMQAQGGRGGVRMSAQNSTKFLLGGAAIQSINMIGYFQYTGEHGGYSVMNTYSSGISGSGGNSLIGTGGLGRVSNGAGNAGSYGGGGSGAYVQGNNFYSGGDGGNGVAIITFY